MKKYLGIFLFSFFLFLSAGKLQAADFAKVILAPKEPLIAGRPLTIDIFIDSNVEVNAAQLNFTIPNEFFALSSVDTSNSKFTIKAEETVGDGFIKLARGNVKALKGKNLFATLTITPKSSNASVSQITYNTKESLVMSKNNVNILTNSEVLTVKPVEPTPDQNKKKGFFQYFKIAVSEFVKSIFGR